MSTKSIKYAFILFALIIIKPLTAQTSYKRIQKESTNNEGEKELLKNRWEQALGTFQFQIINSRINPQIDINVIDEIEKSRDENKIIYIDYKENIKIMILPKSAIAHRYEKLELFKHISTKTN